MKLIQATISRLTIFIYLLVSGLLSFSLVGQGELYQVSHGPVSMVIPLQALSEKGENYFAREQQALERAQHGFSVGNTSSSSFLS